MQLLRKHDRVLNCKDKSNSFLRLVILLIYNSANFRYIFHSFSPHVSAKFLENNYFTRWFDFIFETILILLQLLPYKNYSLQKWSKVTWNNQLFKSINPYYRVTVPKPFATSFDDKCHLPHQDTVCLLWGFLMQFV